MRTQKRQLGLYALLACMAGSVGGPLRAEDEGINWLGSFSEARQQARQTNKPIFVEFRCEA